MMNIGGNIKRLRQRHNLTQDQVAEKLCVSYQAVSKWENNINAPDISLLPEIANLFDVSIDTLFSDHPEEDSDLRSVMKDDGVIRVVQIRNKKILRISPVVSQNMPSIEIAFPHDCNNSTQYFKVEVWGHVIADGSINGDVVCHQTIKSGEINGDVKSEGDIKVSELNADKVICQSITDCYRLHANTVECAGDITSAHLNCDQITYRHA